MKTVLISKKVFLKIPNIGFRAKQLDSIVQSHRAFLAAESLHQERIARVINEEIISSESESDDPEEYIGVQSATSDAGAALVKKRRKAVKRRATRQ